MILLAWGCSSVGRARQSHCRGQGFEPPHLHHVLYLGDVPPAGLEMRPDNAAPQLVTTQSGRKEAAREKGKFWEHPRPRQRATPSALLCYKWMSVEMPCKSQTLMV